MNGDITDVLTGAEARKKVRRGVNAVLLIEKTKPIRDDKGKWVKGHEMPTDWREKISKATKGEKNPFFGKSHTELTRLKIRTARLKQDMSSRRGKSMPPEVREKVSLSKLTSPKTRRGNTHHKWRGGCEEWLKNQRRIMDNFTCASCGLYDIEIVEVDHIIPKYRRPDLARDISNLQTLCPNCHVRKTLKERTEDNKNICQKQ